MLFTSKLTTCFRRNIRQIVQMSTNVSTATLPFKPKFSEEEQQKILTILNDSNMEQLAQFDVTRVRIKNLENWRTKHGPFQSLSDILEVEGLGEKVLERLCNSIVFERQESPPTAIKNFNNSKNRRQILTPQLNYDLANRLKNAVGIHLAPTGVSWAKLSVAQNELETWNFHDFSTLPQKLLPTDTFDLALTLLTKIPVGDVYIMEASPNQQAPPGGKPMPTYTQHLELSSMLLALINTSPRHNLKVDSSNTSELQSNCDNRVYYLRANLPARLFRTLVGNERVAATGIIAKLLENNTLPCTAITVKQAVRDFYGSQHPVHKEIMGQAIMLATTFMDLCVYKNPISAAAILPGRRQKD